MAGLKAIQSMLLYVIRKHKENAKSPMETVNSFQLSCRFEIHMCANRCMQYTCAQTDACNTRVHKQMHV